MRAKVRSRSPSLLPVTEILDLDLGRAEIYWTHVAQYPCHIELDDERIGSEAHDALIYCYCDRALFKKSNATWSLENAKELLAIYDILKGMFSAA